MELWIRSQNKEMLYIAKEIYFYEYADNKVGIEVNQENFGIYKTKERALEVLDEIQRILHPTLFLSAEINTNDNNWVENGIMYQKYKDNYSIQELSSYVYEMPKE